MKTQAQSEVRLGEVSAFGPHETRVTDIGNAIRLK